MITRRVGKLQRFSVNKQAIVRAIDSDTDADNTALGEPRSSVDHRKLGSSSRMWGASAVQPFYHLEGSVNIPRPEPPGRTVVVLL